MQTTSLACASGRGATASEPSGRSTQTCAAGCRRRYRLLCSGRGSDGRARLCRPAGSGIWGDVDTSGLRLAAIRLRAGHSRAAKLAGKAVSLSRFLHGARRSHRYLARPPHEERHSGLDARRRLGILKSRALPQLGGGTNRPADLAEQDAKFGSHRHWRFEPWCGAALCTCQGPDARRSKANRGSGWAFTFILIDVFAARAFIALWLRVLSLPV